MGLMIYAFATSHAIGDIDFQHQEDAVAIFTWRRHWELAFWFGKLYQGKGGSRQDTKGKSVRIDASDLDRLENAIETGAIPASYARYITSWDSSEPSDDLAFIRIARKALGEGGRIYCVCCW